MKNVQLGLYAVRTVNFELNCIMTNVMYKFLIYLSIYFCLTFFGLKESPKHVRQK
jgi:hypothetical protein